MILARGSRVGVVGTGFIAKGLTLALAEQPDLTVCGVLTRTNPLTRSDFPRQDLLTRSVDELISNADVVVECSGDVIHATAVIDRAMEASVPVVTMDAEMHVTTGSYFARKGFITEAEGDQPGCLAALREEVLQMGFRPVVYGNVKGFLNHCPNRHEMEFWAKKQNISLDKVISFTDGTKVEIEQALVANGTGSDIAVPGLLGIASEDVPTGAIALAERASIAGCPISDYILSPKSPPGVFVVARHDERQKASLAYFKMGEGPYYVLLRNFHLCHLEIAKTIRRVLKGGGVLLNNGVNPAIGIAAVAKRRLVPGDLIRRGIGSFDVRGVAIRIADQPKHVPIGLLANAAVAKRIEPGQLIASDDVELPESLALQAWRETNLHSYGSSRSHLDSVSEKTS